MNRAITRILAVCIVVVFAAGLTGCAGTMNAIENREMTVTANMSDTIFLDAQTLADNRTCYVRVTNTSDMQEIKFEQMLREKLAAKGITLVNSPKQAAYLVQANVLYMDYEKKGATADGMLAGGYGGALAGAALSKGDLGHAAGVGLGAVVGSVAGGLLASAIHVDTYVGVCDVQIQERVEGGVSGNMVTDAKQGSSSRLKTQREIKSDFQTYRTRIAAKAKQTNINKAEAAQVLSDKLATQISGMF